MKPILLLFGGFVVTTSLVAQYATNNSGTSAPAQPQPVIVQPNAAQALPDNGVVLQELSPPLRAGRKGGVYITGAPPIPAATNIPTRPVYANTTNYAATTNQAGTNAVAAGATGSNTYTNGGTGASVEAPAVMQPPEPVFVPTFNQPGLPGAPGGRRVMPPTGAPPNGGIIPNNGPTIPALGAPAGTTTPALPPNSIAVPAAPATGVGGPVPAPPPPITTPPPPISGPRR